MPLAFNRTIESPGVEIRELDYTLNVGLPVGTNVLVAGFSQQGPTDELLNITSITEFEQIFGVPTDAAERYFYHTCRQILLKNGNLIATRLPYGSGEGAGFGSEYSALVYPVYAAPTSGSQIAVLSGASAALSGYVDGVNFAKYKIDIDDKIVVQSATIAGSPFSYTISGLTPGTSATYLNNTDPIFWLSGSPAYSSVSGALNDVGGRWDVTTNLISSYSPAASSVTQIWGITGTNYSVVTNVAGFATQFSTASSFIIGQPTQVTLSEAQYDAVINGQISWKDLGGVGQLSGVSKFNFDDLGKSGLIVLNSAKRTTNELFEGQYVILADNTKIGFGTDYDNVRGYKTVTKYASANTNMWSAVNEGTLNFSATGQYMASSGSTSEVIESIPGYEFGDDDFNDSLVLGVLKLRTTPFAKDGRSTTLDQVVTESYVGSLWANRQIQSRTGGPLESFFLEKLVNENSSNIKVFVNPWISKKSDDWLDESNNLTKEVRVYSPQRTTEVYAVPATGSADDIGLNVALHTYDYTNGAVDETFAKYADYGFAIGQYQTRSLKSVKEIGELPKKIERALRLAENPDEISLDIICEGGLGTIDVYRKVAKEIAEDSNSVFYSLYANYDGSFRDDVYVPGIQKGLDTDTGYTAGKLIDQDYGGSNNGATGRDSFVANQYQQLFQTFAVFCEFTRRPGTLFIADGLRNVFVQGNRSVLACVDETGKKYNFPQHIYWGLRNLFAESNTSYACVYANWVKAYDTTQDNMVWLPFSGFAAGIMCDTDRNFFPWFAPAGLNRGRITDVVEIAINPTLKQRDLLYRHGLNPICFFPQDGFVVWGQKTLFKKPSAFDRINVRRLFLILEKATVAIARYFVFEPNTIFTRSRLVDAIKPIFERAKNNEGLYDYLIICDERNNTPDVIDRNELAVDIYLKPVRAAEFILISFIATRTGQDFAELI